MQLQMPFFPEQTKYINSTLGIFERDGFVYYLHNGSPIYCHAIEDRNGYRFIVGNLIHNKLCTISEFHESLGEARKNIERYAKTFREKGAEYFFRRKETRGQCYKMTDELKVEIQAMLDEGTSQYRISKDFDISESAIRYHLKNGNLTLKKKLK
jgi:biotin operon repressor